MTIMELDGTLCTTARALHDHLQQRLRLPDYYGQNLDALYDLLTEPGEPARVQLRNMRVLQENLGNYGDAFLMVLEQAARENPRLELLEEP